MLTAAAEEALHRYAAHGGATGVGESARNLLRLRAVGEPEERVGPKRAHLRRDIFGERARGAADGGERSSAHGVAIGLSVNVKSVWPLK